MPLGYYNTVVTLRGIIHQNLEACIRAEPLKPREVYKIKLILGRPQHRVMVRDHFLSSFFQILGTSRHTLILDIKYLGKHWRVFKTWLLVHVVTFDCFGK